MTAPAALIMPVMVFPGLAASVNAAAAAQANPNVLFLAVDDMNDRVNCLDGYEGTVHTPNIDRLAKRGADSRFAF